MKLTLPLSPRVPPCLPNAARTSLAVRLRLSVKRLDDQRHAARPVALVAHLLVLLAAFALRRRA